MNPLAPTHIAARHTERSMPAHSLAATRIRCPHIRGRRGRPGSEKTEERRIQHQCKLIRKHVHPHHPHHALAVVCRSGARSTEHARRAPANAGILAALRGDTCARGWQESAEAGPDCGGAAAPVQRSTPTDRTISRQLLLVSRASTVPVTSLSSLPRGPLGSNGGHR
jgi:hypothetical protein